MKSAKSIYKLAYNQCIKKGIISKSCDKFLKLDFKLKKCKTSRCKIFYRSKIKSLKKMKSSKRKKSIRRKK